jgi:hypothetical protein
VFRKFRQELEEFDRTVDALERGTKRRRGRASHEPAKNLDEGRERRHCFAFTPARQDRRLIGDATSELGGEPRLADASLAGDEDRLRPAKNELRASCAHSLPCSREGSDLGIAVDEWSGPRGDNGLWGRPLEWHDLSGLSEQRFVT